MNCVAIIPARFASTRFPGKPLAQIAGKSMIQRVIEQAQKSKCIQEVWVTTDDDSIHAHVESLNIPVFRTSTSCQSGTERILELLPIIEQAGFDTVINIQGDEPFIHPETIDSVLNCLQIDGIATACIAIQNVDDIQDPNRVKIVLNSNGQAMYFSRSPIPYSRNPFHSYKKHLGIYAFALSALKKISKLGPHALEMAESLEQLRWLANGIPIQVIETELESIGIDTPEDLEHAKKLHFPE